MGRNRTPKPDATIVPPVEDGDPRIPGGVHAVLGVDVARMLGRRIDASVREKVHAFVATPGTAEALRSAADRFAPKGRPAAATAFLRNAKTDRGSDGTHTLLGMRPEAESWEALAVVATRLLDAGVDADVHMGSTLVVDVRFVRVAKEARGIGPALATRFLSLVEDELRSTARRGPEGAVRWILVAATKPSSPEGRMSDDIRKGLGLAAARIRKSGATAPELLPRPSGRLASGPASAARVGTGGPAGSTLDPERLARAAAMAIASAPDMVRIDDVGLHGIEEGLALASLVAPEARSILAGARTLLPRARSDFAAAFVRIASTEPWARPQGSVD